MIEVTIYESGKTHSLEIKGHSGYACKGSDIICSAVSALTHAYAIQIDNKSEQEVIEQCNIDVSDGYTKVSYSDVGNVCTDLRQMLYEGLEAVRDTYPDYISINKIKF